MDNNCNAISLQSVLASLLWSLGSLPSVPFCRRQRNILMHQLRYVHGHAETELMMRDVTAQLLCQFEDAQAQQERSAALYGKPDVGVRP